MDELQRRLSAKGHLVEWDQVLKDLRSVCEVPVRKDDQWSMLRTPLQGVSGKVLQAVGVVPPPPCRPSNAKAGAQPCIPLILMNFVEATVEVG